MALEFCPKAKIPAVASPRIVSSPALIACDLSAKTAMADEFNGVAIHLTVVDNDAVCANPDQGGCGQTLDQNGAEIGNVESIAFGEEAFGKVKLVLW